MVPGTSRHHLETKVQRTTTPGGGSGEGRAASGGGKSRVQIFHCILDTERGLTINHNTSIRRSCMYPLMVRKTRSKEPYPG